jgi:hypothetical protein
MQDGNKLPGTLEGCASFVSMFSHVFALGKKACISFILTPQLGCILLCFLCVCVCVCVRAEVACVGGCVRECAVSACVGVEAFRDPSWAILVALSTDTLGTIAS